MHGGEGLRAAKPDGRVVGLHLVAAELAFLLGPFVVIGFAYFYKGDLHDLLYTPYWSIASAVLIGQALVRFIVRMLQSNLHDPSIAWERVTLVFSLLIVLVLIPALVVLLLVVISTQPSFFLGVAQLILFLVAFSLYLVLGWIAQDMMANSGPAEEYSNELDIGTASVPRSYQKASGE
jgi:hypothetical protein